MPEIQNCLTCGTGRYWWFRTWRGALRCLTCDGNPIKGNGQPDWKDRQRAKMVAMFGPRQDGDAELLKRYDSN